MKKLTIHQSRRGWFTVALMILFMSGLTAQVSITNKTDVTCHGAKDGTATASVTGGTPPYTYQWTPAGGNGATATGLSGGTYKVVVTDANDCEVETTVTIEEPNEIFVNAQASGSILRNCQNRNPSQVTLTMSATGGAPPFQYSWPGGSRTVTSPGSYTATAIDSRGCSKSKTVNVGLIDVLCAYDPNDIAGPEGYDTIHWIQKDEVMPFKIRFENDPVFATAPAQIVTIHQDVHPNMNIFSFRLSDFGFGDFTFSVPENTTFYTQRLDVRDSLGVYVDVVAGIDIINNQLFWIFESIDPVTGTEPTDATKGFLPVNDSVRRLGEGFVTYTIMPKSGVVTGDTITATASIVFDINEAIITNTWLNTIDAVAPVSYVVNNFTTYADTTSIPISFGGQDDPGGTGIKSFHLYVSKNNGPWELYQEYDADTLALFTAASGNYRFYSIAEDFVGNMEPSKSQPDAEVTIINNLRYAVHGTVSYDNFNKTAIGGSQAFLYDRDMNLLDSTATDNGGKYQFGGLKGGRYIVGAASAYPWGGVNATDALIIHRASVNMVNLDPVQEVVADVNSSSSITAADALLSLRRSLGLDNAFDAGDWHFIPDTILLIGDSLLDHKVFGLCIGDVNRSYQTSGFRLFRSIYPEYQGVLEVSSDEFIYPLYIKAPAHPGALSLTLRYPSDQVSVTGIDFKGDGLLYNDLGGELLIGWADLDGVGFHGDEMLVGIRMKRTNTLMTETSLQPLLAEPSEIADTRAEVMYNTVIRMPEVQFREATPDRFAMISNYPNPSSDYTTFHYQLPVAGDVEIRLHNTLGELVAVFVIGDQQVGEHQHTIATTKLAAGVYHYTLVVTAKEKQHHATGKLVVGVKE
jgi:hypothetical protein